MNESHDWSGPNFILIGSVDIQDSGMPDVTTNQILTWQGLLGRGSPPQHRRVATSAHGWSHDGSSSESRNREA